MDFIKLYLIVGVIIAIYALYTEERDLLREMGRLSIAVISVVLFYPWIFVRNCIESYRRKKRKKK